jgi:hypothetical protein
MSSHKARKVESNGRRLSTNAREIEQILKENEVESLDLKFLALGPGKITSIANSAQHLF